MLSPTLANDFSSRLTLAFATFQSVSFSPRSTPLQQIPCSHSLPDSFSLFALFSTLASFVFNNLRTLFPKHRGCGVPLRHLRALRARPFFRRASALPFAFILSPLYFHQLTNPSSSRIDLQHLCFHSFTNPFFRNLFVFTSIQNPGVWDPNYG